VEAFAAPAPVGNATAANPSTGWIAPVARPAPSTREDSLPESTIRPEYRNSGRPIV